MIQVVIRFFTLNAISEHPMIYWGIGLVWLLLLIASISSLRNSDLPPRAALAWFLVILFVPFLGLACYCIRCLLRSDWSLLKMLLVSPSAAKTVQPK